LPVSPRWSRELQQPPTSLQNRQSAPTVSPLSRKGNPALHGFTCQHLRLSQTVASLRERITFVTSCSLHRSHAPACSKRVHGHSLRSSQHPGHAAPPTSETIGKRPTAVPEATMFFGSVDESARVQLLYRQSRQLGPQRPRRWSAESPKYQEGIKRLDALPRSGVALRLVPIFGSSKWWRDHADCRIRILMSLELQFADSRGSTTQAHALRCTSPPGRGVHSSCLLTRSITWGTFGLVGGLAVLPPPECSHPL